MSYEDKIRDDRAREAKFIHSLSDDQLNWLIGVVDAWSNASAPFIFRESRETREGHVKFYWEAAAARVGRLRG